VTHEKIRIFQHLLASHLIGIIRVDSLSDALKLAETCFEGPSQSKKVHKTREKLSFAGFIVLIPSKALRLNPAFLEECRDDG
jgi:hypothetical protein